MSTPVQAGTTTLSLLVIVVIVIIIIIYFIHFFLYFNICIIIYQFHTFSSWQAVSQPALAVVVRHRWKYWQ